MAADGLLNNWQLSVPYHYYRIFGLMPYIDKQSFKDSKYTKLFTQNQLLRSPFFNGDFFY